MKRSSLAVISAVGILLLGGVILYGLVSGRLREPSGPEPGTVPSPPGPEAEVAPDEVPRGAVGVYFLGPSAATDRAQRVELTLLEASLKRSDGKEFPVYAGRLTVVIQQDVPEKLFAELIPAGEYGELKLTFQPSAIIVAPDGAAAPAFLPQNEMTLSLTEKLTQGRTMAVVFRLDFKDAFGIQNSVPTFRIPATLEAETTTFGGIFASKKSFGTILSPATLTLPGMVKADTGMNIAPAAPQEGTAGYTPPNIPTPQQ